MNSTTVQVTKKYIGKNSRFLGKYFANDKPMCFNNEQEADHYIAKELRTDFGKKFEYTKEVL